jgi:hypothetical protein
MLQNPGKAGVDNDAEELQTQAQDRHGAGQAVLGAHQHGTWTDSAPTVLSLIKLLRRNEQGGL